MAEADFFERKEKKQLKISDFTDFKHDEELDTSACGLNSDLSNFESRNNLFFDELQSIFNGKFEGNPVSIVAECVEQNFSSREISFLLSKSIMSDLIENSKNVKDGE